MTSAMLVTMVLCFALSVSVAVSIGLAAILGVLGNNAWVAWMGDLMPAAVAINRRFVFRDDFPTVPAVERRFRLGVR